MKDHLRTYGPYWTTKNPTISSETITPRKCYNSQEVTSKFSLILTKLLGSVTAQIIPGSKVFFGVGNFNKASNHKTALLEVRNLFLLLLKIIPEAFFYLPLLTLHDYLTKLETSHRLLLNKNLDKLLTPSFITFTLPPFNKDKFKLTPRDTQGLYWSRHIARLIALTWLMNSHILG